MSPGIRDGSETRLASDRRGAVLGILLWLGSLSAAAQEPVEPSEFFGLRGSRDSAQGWKPSLKMRSVSSTAPMSGAVPW